MRNSFPLWACMALVVSGCGEPDTRDLPPSERIDRCVDRRIEIDEAIERRLREDKEFDELRRHHGRRQGVTEWRADCLEAERAGTLQDDGGNGTDEFIPGFL